MNLQEQAKNVAAQGRFGDSMLLHVNPTEVRGLASAMPITINPETGQPEAFLPFLAPMIGSFLGSSLLGGTLGSVAAGALGSGLAQYAVTGDLKKGLLAGLTGYGLGTALQGAGAAATAATDATQAASTAAQEAVANLGTKQVTDAALNEAVMGSLGQTAANQTAVEAAKAALPYNVAPIAEAGAAAADPTMFQNLQAAFSSPGTIDPLSGTVSGAGDFSIGTGASNLLGGLMQPGAYIPAGIGMGGTAIMESQEAFENYLNQLDADEAKRIRDMYARYPEAVPGTFLPPLTYQEGGNTSLNGGGDYEYPIFDPTNPVYQNIFMSLLNDANSNNSSGANSSGAEYIPQRVTNPIPAGFMPGFMPEFNYFSNTNPSDTELQGPANFGNIQSSQQPIPVSQPFSPTTMPSYQQFYGSAMQGVPSVINPFESFDPMMVIPPFNPAPTPQPPTPEPPLPQPPMPQPPTPQPPISGPPGNPGDPIIEPFGDDIADPIDPVLEEGAPAISFLPPVLKQEPPVLPGIPPIQEQENVFDNEKTILPEPGDFSDLRPIAPRPVMPRPIYEVGDEFNKRNPVFPVDPGMRNAIVPPPPGVSTVIPTPPGGFVKGPDPIMVGGPVLPVNPPVQTNFPINPNVQFPGFMNPMQPKVIGMSAGESTSVEVDKLPEGLKAMYDSGPKGKEGVEKIAAKTDKFSMGGIISKMQTGRMTELQNDPLTLQVVQFLLGNISDDSVIAAFVDKYGPEIFRELRRGVLASVEPNAQTEGMIKGSLEGGMADDIFGSIGDTTRNGQRVALSQDEYVVPADAVSMLGDGSSDAGAKKLDEMLDRIRLDKTGRTAQAKEINDSKVLPA
tara:strand:- start:18834 stop:21368 length:2535 start_codon:yes stop_codon:yes gene_type:complete